MFWSTEAPEKARDVCLAVMGIVILKIHYKSVAKSATRVRPIPQLETRHVGLGPGVNPPMRVPWRAGQVRLVP